MWQRNKALSDVSHHRPARPEKARDAQSDPGRGRKPTVRAAGALSLLLTLALLLGACSTSTAGDSQVDELAATVIAQQAQIRALEDRVTQLSIQVNANTAVLDQTEGVTSNTTGAAPVANPPSGDAAIAAAMGAGEISTATPATPPAELPEATSTPLPTPEPLPTPTPFPAFAVGPLTGDPPDGMARPEGVLAERWAQEVDVQQALGWASDASPRALDAVMQPFEGGLMVWRSDDRSITVFLNEGMRWVRYPDTFQEGEPESDPTLSAPGGLRQPVRGFGKLWRSQPDLRAQLGWATDRERPYDGQIQDFIRGSYMAIGIERIIAGHTPDGTPIWFR